MYDKESCYKTPGPVSYTHLDVYKRQGLNVRDAIADKRRNYIIYNYTHKLWKEEI